MNSVKIEFDLPEFENNLEVNVIIRKDGEVVINTTSPSNEKIEEVKEKPKKATKEKPVANNKQQPSNFGGNMMGIDF